MINIGLIEDDSFIREELLYFFKLQEIFSPVNGYCSVEQFLIEAIAAPNVILLDIELPGMDGLQGAFHIKQKFPLTEILMLTVFEEKDRIFKALQAGASGYLIKNTPLIKLKAAILEVLEGGAPMSPIIAKKVINYFSEKNTAGNTQTDQLTAREREVSLLLIDGKTYKQVAYHLHISPDTVRQHIKNIYKKLQINCRVELIREFKSN